MLLQEFRQFIARGNVIDMAVGIIVGAAFTKIVNSLVEDIFMPLLGFATPKGMDFSNLYLNLSGRHFESLKAAKDAGAAVIGYGVFINTVINFLIVSFVIFMLIKQINRLKREEPKHEGPPPPPPADVVLLTEIRDLLKQKNS
jgi:large conductance mechanosensitive channel